MFKKRGQSTLEYVIVLTAIIAVVVAFAAVFLRDKVKSSLEHVSTEMEEEVQKINF